MSISSSFTIHVAVLSAATLIVGCGGAPVTPVGPTTDTSPAPQAATAALLLQVNDAVVSVVTLPGLPPAMSYSSCFTLHNSSTTSVTVRYRMDILDANGSPYPTLSYKADEGTQRPKEWHLGCGTTLVYDFDLTHPIATSYRMRLTYVSDNGTSGAVEGVGPIRVTMPIPPRVVINEFRTRGPNGSTDQFVELFNESLTASSGAATLCRNVNGTQAPECMSLPIAIGPLCHFLITAPGYSGLVRGDATMNVLMHDDGGIGFAPSFRNDTQNDVVGMNDRFAGNHEGTALAPFGPSNIDRSYSRTGRDTNDNARDFSITSPSTPQNSTSCGSR